MINSINNNHIMQNVSMTRQNNSVSNKVNEEANESISEKMKETNNQGGKSTTSHIIDSYA